MLVRPSATDLITAINAEHRHVLAAIASGTAHAIKAGELLTQAKQSLVHGEWEDWVKDNLDFSARTARLYMQLYRLDPKRQRVADLPLRDAVRWLGKALGENESEGGRNRSCVPR
jgi:hypothetical protein